MKFTDGNWMHLPGVSAHHASEAHLAYDQGDRLRILAPCHPIRHRGDTLSGPLLTVDLSSPLPDVIRVKVTHFEGALDNGPHFEVTEAPGATKCEISE